MAKSKKSNFSLFDTITPAIVNFLETEIAKQAVIKLVGSTVGFKAWLVKFVVEEVVIEKAIEPGVEYGERKVILFYDKAKGHYVYKQLEETTNVGNLAAWRAAARKL